MRVLVAGLHVSVSGSAAAAAAGSSCSLVLVAGAVVAAGAAAVRDVAPARVLRGSATVFFLCLLPVRPMPPLSRGMKEHLQTHKQHLSKLQLDRSNRTEPVVDPAVLAACSGQQRRRAMYLQGLLGPLARNPFGGFSTV